MAGYWCTKHMWTVFEQLRCDCDFTWKSISVAEAQGWQIIDWFIIDWLIRCWQVWQEQALSGRSKWSGIHHTFTGPRPTDQMNLSVPLRLPVLPTYGKQGHISLCPVWIIFLHFIIHTWYFHQLFIGWISHIFCQLIHSFISVPECVTEVALVVVNWPVVRCWWCPTPPPTSGWLRWHQWWWSAGRQSHQSTRENTHQSTHISPVYQREH